MNVSIGGLGDSAQYTRGGNGYVVIIIRDFDPTNSLEASQRK